MSTKQILAAIAYGVCFILLLLDVTIYWDHVFMNGATYVHVYYYSNAAIGITIVAMAALVCFMGGMCDEGAYHDDPIHGDGSCYRCCGMILFFVGPPAVIVLAFIAFVLNCMYAPVACYTVYTPIYGYSLFVVHLVFLAVLFGGGIGVYKLIMSRRGSNNVMHIKISQPPVPPLQHVLVNYDDK
jgi:hypothetical protein